MTKAIWNGAVIADSNETLVIEGNHYFPPSSVQREFLRPSPETSGCPWKGRANYFNLLVEGKTNEAAAWTYAEPSLAAANIKDYVAFWRGVRVQ